MRVALFVAAAVAVALGTDAAELASARSDAGTKWALLVGVDRYDHRAFKSLSYCGKDAVGLRDVLVRRAAYPKRQVVVLHDQSDNQALRPTRDNILRALDDFLSRPGPEDLVVVSFSGHGTFMEPASYLCPADADPESPQTMLRVDEFYAKLGRDCRAGHKALLIDACRSLSPEGKGLQVDALSARFARGLRNVPRGVWVLSSCTPGQASYENALLGHGVFMHYVIEGLSGRADARQPGYSGGNRDGRVQSWELFNYSNENSTAFVAGHHHAQQTPEVHCLDSTALNLADLVPDLPKRITNAVGIELAFVPRGEFLMGSERFANERPPHRVAISEDHYLGVTEVTQAQYEAIMKTNPSHFAAAGGGRQMVEGLETSRFPVESVTYDEACEFCRRLARIERLPEGTYRLPTEAEWEYAARAKATEEYGPAGNGGFLEKHAWFGGNARGRTHEVGKREANDWGFHDMQGNVAEWCADWYDPGYYGTSPAEDPVGPGQPHPRQLRLLRGGAWCLGTEFCRVSDRNAIPSAARERYAGFRIVRETFPRPQ